MWVCEHCGALAFKADKLWTVHNCCHCAFLYWVSLPFCCLIFSAVSILLSYWMLLSYYLGLSHYQSAVLYSSNTLLSHTGSHDHLCLISGSRNVCALLLFFCFIWGSINTLLCCTRSHYLSAGLYWVLSVPCSIILGLIIILISHWFSLLPCLCIVHYPSSFLYRVSHKSWDLGDIGYLAKYGEV
jgi:hypothetical protein